MTRRRRSRNKITLTHVGMGAALFILLFAIAHPSSAITTTIIVLLLVIVVYTFKASWMKGASKLKKAQEKSRHMEAAERAYKTHNVDYLTPREFEYYVASIFERFGCSTEVTPGTNDRGIDVILDYGNTSIGVQVKKWQSGVGRPDLQRLVGAGKPYDRIMCVTNSYYAKPALEYAKEQNIMLVDGEKLESLAEQAFGKDHVHKTLSMKIMGLYQG